MATPDRPAAAPPPDSGAEGVPPARRGLPGARADGSDLPRLPEAFHRVYSPPEGPKTKVAARRLGVGPVAAVLAVMALAAAGILAYGRGALRTGTTATPSHRASASSAARPALLASIPNACDVLPGGTVRRLVPTDRPDVNRMGVDTASVCEYSLTQGRTYRAVQVDARAFLPGTSTTRPRA